MQDKHWGRKIIVQLVFTDVYNVLIEVNINIFGDNLMAAIH